MTGKPCSNCKNPLPTGAIYCDICGERVTNPTPAPTGPVREWIPLIPPTSDITPPATTSDSKSQPDTTFCAKCNQKNLSDSHFCEACGAKLG